MANVTGYSETDDPEWVKAHLDDGTSVHVNDPDSSWRAQHPQIGAEQAPDVTTDPTTGQVIPPVTAPAGSGSLLPNLAADYGMGARPPAPAEPAAAKEVPAIPGADAPGGPLSTPQPSLNPQVITIPGGPGQTTTMNESTTSGLSKEGKAAVNAANETARKSQGAADLANIESTTAVRHHAYDAAVASQAKLQGQIDADAAEKKTKDALVSDELRRIQERNAQPIDPKAAFKQDGMSAYALLASIGTAISNVGSRAEGQQGEDVLKPINDIIDRSVKTQLAQKQADFETGRITLAAYQSQAQEVTSHLYALSNQMMLAQAKVADTEEEKMGITSLAASLQAKRDAAAVTAAQATADHKTSVWKQSSKPGTPAQTLLVAPNSQSPQVDQKIWEDTAAQAYPGMKPEQRQKQIDEFNKRYEKTAVLKGEADGFEKLLKTLPGNDLPGSGVIASHLPNAMVSNQGVDMRQRAKKLLIDYTHEMGARLNPADVELMNGVFEGAKDKRSMLRAIGMLKGDLAHEDHSIQTQYPALHNAKQLIERRQGTDRMRSGQWADYQNRAAVPAPSETSADAETSADDGDEE